MRKGIVCLVVLALLAVGSPVFAAKSDASLKAILDQAIADNNIIGAVAMVRAPDGTIYKAASGLANTANNTPMATDMHFRIASVSKIFSAAICLRLQQEGVLDLDDPITTWFPTSTFPNAGTITLRDLLAMRAGLNEIPEAMALQFMTPPATVEWTEPLLATNAVALEAPDTAYRYINRNTVLANLICAQATGKTYRELLNEYVYTPYGLTNTSIPTDTSLPAEYAHMYGFFNAVDGTPSAGLNDITNIARGSFLLGAGGMVSNAQDIITWLVALLDQGFLNAQSLAEMQTYQAAGVDFTYGLGFKDMGNAVGHDGSFMDAHTSLAVEVGNYKLVILANGCTVQGQATARTLKDTIIDQFGLTDTAIVPTVLTPLLLTN